LTTLLPEALTRNRIAIRLFPLPAAALSLRGEG
jgi:hypothetical protein